MDEYETPIESIRQNDQQSQPINYNDMLQTMESNGGHTHEQGQSNFPPNPIVQSRNPVQQGQNMNMNFVNPQNQAKAEEPDSNISLSNMQRDFLFIIVPSVIIYSSQIQSVLIRSIPSMFKDDKPTVIGNVMNAGLIALCFILIKNMKINFN